MSNPKVTPGDVLNAQADRMARIDRLENENAELKALIKWFMDQENWCISETSSVTAWDVLRGLSSSPEKQRIEEIVKDG